MRVTPSVRLVLLTLAMTVAAITVDRDRALVVTAQSVELSDVDASYFASLRWRSIGPARGGRSIAVGGSTDRPLEYYFGATGGGVWKTTDAGQTWNPVGDKILATSSVGALAVAPSNPDVVYAGMGEVQLRGNVIQGDGVYKTADGGKTWTHAGLKETLAIGRVRVHPKDPDRVWVAALGNPYAPNAERGVFRSKDGGKTWERTLFRDEKSGAVDLVIDPANPDILYASLWEVHRTPHSLSSGGPGSGLFKSTDGGGTWTEISRNAGLPKGVLGKIGVSVSGADSNRVYAIVEADEGGVFSSDDGGTTWKLVSSDRRLRQRAFYYTRVYADPRARDTVYVLNTGFYRSTDGGKTYKTIRVPHGDNHDLWIAPNDPRRMINSNDGGANVSFNTGESWTEQDYPTAQFYNVFTTKHVPYHVCGAQQDNSTACVPSTGGELYAVGGGESGYIAPDPRHTDVFFAGSYGGLLTRFDRRTGQSRNITVWPENPMGHSASDIAERFQWTFPIVFSPHDPNVIYTGSQHLWRTANDGQTWTRISADLTRHDPATIGPSGGPITLDQTGVETYATIFTIAPSRVERGVLWVGSDDGLVHVTRDEGQTWTNVTPKELAVFSRISLIEASPHKPGTAYVAANRYQRADRGPYVFKTGDYGRTWTKIVGGLPPDDFARAIREDTKRAGLLYLGTEHGIFMSFNDGGKWQSLRLEMPVTPVHGIVVEENDLVVGTHGRSFFVLDGIHVLRQLTPDVVTSALHLFEPPGAVRTVAGGRGAAGRGGPPRGVTVDYYLKKAAQSVTIEIADASGRTIKTFKSTKPEEKKPEDKKDPGREDPEEEDGPRTPRPPRVETKAGLNRFVWDLRYSDATTFPNLILWAGSVRGPVAPPGSYQVKLTADGETRTAKVMLRRSPALAAVTDADLQAQFALALQIRDRVSEANHTVIRLRAIKAQIKERMEKAKDRRISAAGEALTARLTEIEGEIYQYRNQSSQDPLNYPIKLNNKLAALQGVVESADAHPTDQAHAVFKVLSARLDAQLARVRQAIETDLVAFNKLLAAKRVTPVRDEPKKAETL